MVKFTVMIEDQLRAISQAQVGTVVGPAFATIRELVARRGRAYTARPLPRGGWSREPQSCYANALHSGNWVGRYSAAMTESGHLHSDAGAIEGDRWRCAVDRFPSEIISYSLWAHNHFSLTFRDVEDLAKRESSPVGH